MTKSQLMKRGGGRGTDKKAIIKARILKIKDIGEDVKKSLMEFQWGVSDLLQLEVWLKKNRRKNE